MTLQEVNPAVGMILPGAFFDRAETGHLYLINPRCNYYPTLRWRLRKDRLWPHDRRSATFTGGTTVQALTQLSLWLLDYPRRPIRCWRYWVSVGIGGMDGMRLIEYLEGSSYSLKTSCIYCGADSPSDWWVWGKDIGPRCRHGLCQKKGEE